MTDIHLPQRRSMRYKGYDYASAGAYFVTICVWHGHCLLGDVRSGNMALNTAGQAVDVCWHALPERFPTIALDAFQVMPNHVHGIVWLQAEASATSGAASSAPTLGQVMRLFKSTSAIGANQALQRSGRFWLRSYWDRIVRTDQELANIRNYIQTNPQRWGVDRLHPDAPPNKWKQRNHTEDV